jgi:hypothetical protein
MPDKWVNGQEESQEIEADFFWLIELATRHETAQTNWEFAQAGANRQSRVWADKDFNPKLACDGIYIQSQLRDHKSFDGNNFALWEEMTIAHIRLQRWQTEAIFTEKQTQADWC